MSLGGVFGLAPNDLQIITPPQKEEEAILEKHMDETGVGMIEKENKDKPVSNGNLKNNNDTNTQNEKDRAEKLGLDNSDSGLGGFKTSQSNMTLESIPPSMNSRYDIRWLLIDNLIAHILSAYIQHTIQHTL